MGVPHGPRHPFSAELLPSSQKETPPCGGVRRENIARSNGYSAACMPELGKVQAKQICST